MTSEAEHRPKLFFPPYLVYMYIFTFLTIVHFSFRWWSLCIVMAWPSSTLNPWIRMPMFALKYGARTMILSSPTSTTGLSTHQSLIKCSDFPIGQCPSVPRGSAPGCIQYLKHKFLLHYSKILKKLSIFRCLVQKRPPMQQKRIPLLHSSNRSRPHPPCQKGTHVYEGAHFIIHIHCKVTIVYISW